MSLRVGVLGRTRALLTAAQGLVAAGHTIALVWTRKGEAHYRTDAADFAAFAEEAGSRFLDRLPASSAELAQVLTDARCDIGVSVNWPGILPDAVLAATRLGILNAHAGDLPRYRGNACPNWAMLNGESHVGLCVHLMAPELDAGPVVLRTRHPLGPDTYIGDIQAWLDETVPTLLVEAVDGLEHGRLTPVPQPADVRPLRCYPRRPEDSRIEWRHSAEAIRTLIRASSRPFDGAYAAFHDERLTVWRADLHDVDHDWSAVPGQVCFAVDGDPVVACGKGMLRLTDIALGTGGHRESAERVLSSLRNRLT